MSDRLARYDVTCLECGAMATHRVGSALLGPEYGVGFFCEQHLRASSTAPLAIYLLSPPGVAGGDHPGVKIREVWPAAYDTHQNHPSNRRKRTP